MKLIDVSKDEFTYYHTSYRKGQRRLVVHEIDGGGWEYVYGLDDKPEIVMTQYDSGKDVFGIFDHYYGKFIAYRNAMTFISTTENTFTYTSPVNALNYNSISYFNIPITTIMVNTVTRNIR